MPWRIIIPLALAVVGGTVYLFRNKLWELLVGTEGPPSLEVELLSGIPTMAMRHIIQIYEERGERIALYHVGRRVSTVVTFATDIRIWNHNVAAVRILQGSMADDRWIGWIIPRNSGTPPTTLRGYSAKKPTTHMASLGYVTADDD